MLEWVCPRCDRDIDPAFQECPFCANRGEAAPQGPAKTPRQEIFSEAADRRLRFFLGLAAVLALAYFLAVVAAYYWGSDEWLSRLTRWLPWR
jgi:hypothetical protein